MSGRDSIASSTLLASLSMPNRLFDSSQHQRRILRAERDAIADRMFDLCFPADIGHIIEVASGIRLLQVDRGRQLVVLHRDQRGCNPRGAARALRMPDLRLQGRHWNLVRMIAERKLERARLDAIVEIR